ncbi:hypothetical protein M407DRAFT_240987 [Tulasnella calospora MUT 4182]|uniref:Uncharacterized protein n=1 Tax=Tulasnella calospora MUT 4182 TaxID=1051891 RepID=A0A0C3QLH2_9AGAM|nr:hypothetical protein M407DRAFT_240987 [Tulasnella calospora MUT 4182]
MTVHRDFSHPIFVCRRVSGIRLSSYAPAITLSKVVKLGIGDRNARIVQQWDSRHTGGNIFTQFSIRKVRLGQL